MDDEFTNQSGANTLTDEKSLSDTHEEDDLASGEPMNIDTNAFGPGSHTATTDTPGTAAASFSTPATPSATLPSATDIKQSVSDSTAAAVSSVKDTAGQALNSAKQTAGAAVDTAKETAGHALDAVKQQVVQQVNTQKTRAAETLDGFKQSVQEIGDSFNNHGQVMIGGYAHSLANQVDAVSDYVRNSDVDKLAEDAKKFAKDNPAIVIGSAFLIGIALARFLKSSESNVTSTALVPVSQSNGSSPSGGRQDVDSDNAFTTGQHPVTGHGYVSGGVLGGAPA